MIARNKTIYFRRYIDIGGRGGQTFANSGTDCHGTGHVAICKLTLAISKMNKTQKNF